MPRLFTALAEWGACMLFLLQYSRRLRGPRFWLTAAGALVVQVLWLEGTGSLPVAFWMPAMAVAVGLMFLFLAVCGRSDLLGAGYCTVRAFLLAYHLEQRVSQGGDLPRMTGRELLSAASMGLAAFLISNMSFVTANTPFTSSVEQEIANIRTLVDLAGVVILYAYHIQLFELHTRRELDAIKNILQNQYVQYRQSRESIDVINRKYHDLKHQIAVLRAEEDPARRSAFLDQMEEEIQHYEAQNKTGNSVLDTVLTGKSLYCAKHQIKLTCVADGARLSFMDVMDICTLFGNALDNAIECELSIPDKEKRLIHLEVYAKKDFLVIRCENYCPAPPVFQDGLPMTTKADREYHGYGLKSMRYTAQKYGGTMTVQAKDEWFQLTLLFPLEHH